MSTAQASQSSNPNPNASALLWGKVSYQLCYDQTDE